MQLKKYFFSLFLFCLTATSFSQGKVISDSTHLTSDSISVEHFIENLKIDFLDSTFYNTIQLSSSPIHQFTIIPKFHSIFNLFSIDELQSDIFTCKIPRTVFGYKVQSARQQQLLVSHIQNIKQINFYIQYNRDKGEGFYDHQNFAADNLFTQINYTSKNQKYFALIDYTYHKSLSDENGGLANDSLFTALAYTNVKTLPVKFTTAQNRFEKHFTQFNHELILNKFKLIQNLSYKYYRRNFTDIRDTNYYSTFFNDSIYTIDKFQKESIQHDFSLNYTGKIKTSIKYITNYGTYIQNNIDTNSLSHEIVLHINQQLNEFNYSINYHHILTGFNQNNYSGNVQLNYRLKKIIKTIAVQFLASQIRPEVFYWRLNTNYFSWNNTLSPTLSYSSLLSINSTYGELIFRSHFLKNYTYLNNEAFVKQNENIFSIINLQYNFNRKIKKWNIKLSASYQKTVDSILPLSPLNTFLQVCHLSKLKTLDLIVGGNIHYFSSYKSMYFDPSLFHFINQNQFQIGNYPFIGLFLQSDIKNLSIRLQANHINEKLISKSFYQAMSYGAAPRNYQISISWRFTD